MLPLPLFCFFISHTKVALCHGTETDGYTGVVPKSPSALPKSLGIPPILMNDGPQGFRDNAHPGTTTSWPSGLTIAASFDPEVARLWGDAMGKEFRGKGSNVQLGPGLCLARIPRNGRNFEYLSGEDPVLGSTMVKPVVEAIQAHGVAANAKHFVLNNQETNRAAVSAECDARTRWEIYYPPFQAAVDAGVASVMCSYNKINGIYACENNETLSDLKVKMNFTGWVMSDWGATHSTVVAANAGLDQEMPDTGHFAGNLTRAVERGDVSNATIDDKALRIIKALIEVGAVDNPSSGTITANVTSPEHDDLAVQLVSQTTVMLKNDGGFLPLHVSKKGVTHSSSSSSSVSSSSSSSSSSSHKLMAVVGSAAHDAPIVYGGGSGMVIPAHVSTFLEALETEVEGSGVSVHYAPTNDTNKALNISAEADIIFFSMATTSREGVDRDDLSLPEEEASLLMALLQDPSVTAPVVLLVNCPGAVLLPWAEEPQVRSVLVSFMPGQGWGQGVVNLVTGEASPMGRLPLTFPQVENEMNMSTHQFPGYPDPKNPEKVDYSEGLAVGYRWYHLQEDLITAVSPRWPFGFGLSYANFSFSNLTVSSRGMGYLTVEMDAICFGGADTAPRAPSFKVTPQVYLDYPPEAREPPRQLKGFQTLDFGPGECDGGTTSQKHMKVELTPRDHSMWDEVKGEFVMVYGTWHMVIQESSGKDAHSVDFRTGEGLATTYTWTEEDTAREREAREKRDEDWGGRGGEVLMLFE